MPSTIEQIKFIVKNKLGLKVDVIDESKPMKEYGLDSLSQVELLFMIEDHFCVSVPDNRTRIETLNELGTIIDELIAEKSKTA